MEECLQENRMDEGGGLKPGDEIEIEDEAMTLEVIEGSSILSSSLMDRLDASLKSSATDSPERDSLEHADHPVLEEKRSGSNGNGDGDDDEQGSTAMTSEISVSASFNHPQDILEEKSNQEVMPRQQEEKRDKSPSEDWEISWASAPPAEEEDCQFEPLPIDAAEDVEMEIEIDPILSLAEQNSVEPKNSNEGMSMFWTRNKITTEKDDSTEEPPPYSGMYDDGLKGGLDDDHDDDDDAMDNFDPLPMNQVPKLSQGMYQEFNSLANDAGSPPSEQQNYYRANVHNHNGCPTSYNHPHHQFQQQHRLQPSSSGHFNMTWSRNPKNTGITPNSTFDDTYAISNNGMPIGEGGFGVVYSCVSRRLRPSTRNPNKKRHARRAVKIIQIESYNREEIETLRFLSDCPFIVTLQDIFYGLDRVYLVMEEMRGDLLTEINKKMSYREPEARKIMHTLFQAIQFLHTRGVAHRDIKPENVLISRVKRGEMDDGTKVKLADFGLAKRFRDDHGRRFEQPNMFTLCGSPWYAAPEIFGRYPDRVDNVPYDERCDIWSAGTIMYLLIAGYLPFNEKNDVEVVKEVTRGRFKFHDQYWSKISFQAKDLIASLLKVHPVQRCTIQEAIESPWLQSLVAMDDASNGTSRRKRSSEAMVV